MRARSIISLGNFFSVAHFYLIVYILAPFLALYMPANSSGLVVSLGAIITLLFFPYLSQLIARYTAQRLAIYLAAFECVVLLLLAVNPSPLIAVILVALASATSPLIAYQLDLLLEASVEDERMTGRVRTAFLTAGNTALLLAPLVIGILLINGDHYSRVFLFAALTLLPFMLLMLVKSLPQLHAPKSSNIRMAFNTIMDDADLRAIALANAVLQFFYHLAPIYVPLYLHIALQIPWSELGWVLGISLIPFVLIEYPAGWFADTRIGDQFLLAAGFVIMGLAFASLSLVTVHTPILLIVAILITTRTGAALVEAMAEGHFFRRVSDADTSTVSVFRMMRPFGALIAPIIGTLLLSVLGYSGLFVVSGFLILLVGFSASLAVARR
jgi:MFS family permease